MYRLSFQCYYFHLANEFINYTVEVIKEKVAGIAAGKYFMFIISDESQIRKTIETIAIRENLDIVVIHTGTKDVQNNCNIVKKAKKLVSAVKKVDKDNSIKIAFSSIINREDEDFKDKITDVNNKLKNYCNSAGMDFIDNSNIDGSCLNRGKLHLNRKGTAALAKIFCRFLRSLPVD